MRTHIRIRRGTTAALLAVAAVPALAGTASAQGSGVTADFDGDGDHRAEVLVTISRGANTDFRTFVELGPDGPRTLTGPDGQRVDVTEGGGIAARLGYECASNAEGGRDLITLGATRMDTSATLAYEGQRTRYAIENGTLVPVDTHEFSHVGQDDPVLNTDPATCA